MSFFKKYSLWFLLFCSLSSVFIFSCTRKRPVGNVIRIALREKYKTLDPALAQDYYSGIAVRRTYETLYQYHYLKRPYTIEPLLADGMPQISNDLLTYTIKIKKGVFFQADPCFKEKKRELTADDVIFSFKRLADTRVGNSAWWIFDGKVLGLNEWHDQINQRSQNNKEDFYLRSVEGIKSVDRYTIQIKLIKPVPVFLHLLTMNYTGIVAREATDFYGAEFGRHPVGTGPFILENLAANQMIWTRNPNFHGENYPTEGTVEDKEDGLLVDGGKPLPFVDKIVDEIVIEDQPAWLNFIQGSHDYLLRLPRDSVVSVYDKDHKPSQEMVDRGIKILNSPGIEFSYIAFNLEDPAIGGEKNKKLRQAISLALDDAKLIEKFYAGLAVKAESPIPPGIEGFDPKYKNPYRQYNLAKARELLKKAGYSEKKPVPELSIDTLSSTFQRQLAENVQNTLTTLGIKSHINTFSWPELLSRIKRKQSQVWQINWLYDFPDVENGFQLLYGKNISPGSNSTNYVNSKFDKVFEKASVLASHSSQRLQYIRNLRDIYAEDVPFIVTVHRQELRLAHPWTLNLKVHAFEHGVEKYLKIDQAKRNEILKRDAH